jgi:hypothetical protein
MADLNRPRVKSENLVWDVGTLTWVAMTQPGAGGGGGAADVQYVEDAAAVANPTGTALALRRRDTLVSEVSTDGDIIIGNATSKGELYVKHTDFINVKQSGPNAVENNAWWSKIGTTGFQTTAVCSGPFFAVSDVVSGTLLAVTAGNIIIAELWGPSHSGVNVEFKLIGMNGDEVPAMGFRLDTQTSGTSTGVIPDNTSQFWMFYLPGSHGNGAFLARATAFTSGTLNINVDATSSPAWPFLPSSGGAGGGSGDGAILDGLVPSRKATVTGSNALKVDGSAVTQPVSGTFWQATQPISGTVTVQDGGNVISVDDAAGSLTVDDGGGSITVDGTVTSNQGTAAAVANAWPIKVTDATNTATVKAASTAALATDQALVVAVSPNNSVKVTNAVASSLLAQVDQGSAGSPNSGWPVNNGTNAASTVTWDSTTVIDSALAYTTTGFATVELSMEPSGAITGGVLTFEGTDNITYFPITGIRMDSQVAETSFSLNGSPTKKIWQFNVGGLTSFRVRLSTIFTGSSTVILRAKPIAAASAVNVTGSVAANDGGGSLTVDGSLTVTQATGTNLHTVVDSGTISTITNVVHVDDNAGSLTVDGTVTSNQGTANSLANAWPVKVTDGTNTMPTGDTISRALIVKVTDGLFTPKVITGGVQPVASDNSFVVAPGPNGVLGSSQLNAVLNLASTGGTGGTCLGYSGWGGMLVTTGISGTATVSFQITFDSVTPITIPFIDYATDQISTTLSISTNTTTKVWVPIYPGAKTFSINVTATAVAGTTTVTGFLATNERPHLYTHQLPADTWASNVTKLAGTAIDVNSGNVSAGTQRVVLATDQPALTNKLLVTPDANSSINLNQVGGTAIAAKAASTFGVAAIPVWPNAVQRDTYYVAMNGIAIALTAGGGDKGLLSIEHAGASTKNVRIRRILVSGVVTTASAAVVGVLKLNVFTGTAASSGGTTITAAKANQASAAADAVSKHTPTIVAAGGPDLCTMVIATGAGGLTVGTALGTSTPMVLYDWQENGETVPMTLRSGNLESILISANGSWATTAPTITWGITVIFTEE